MDVLTANGTTNIQTSVTGVATGKRKFVDERRDQPFDKRLRFSVRQTESAYRYRDIVVRKQDGFTHVLLSTKSSENNALNPEVRCSRGPLLLRLPRLPRALFPGSLLAISDDRQERRSGAGRGAVLLLLGRS